MLFPLGFPNFSIFTHPLVKEYTPKPPNYTDAAIYAHIFLKTAESYSRQSFLA
jgi:hypothetical protein